MCIKMEFHIYKYTTSKEQLMYDCLWDYSLRTTIVKLKLSLKDVIDWFLVFGMGLLDKQKF